MSDTQYFAVFVIGMILSKPLARFLALRESRIKSETLAKRTECQVVYLDFSPVVDPQLQPATASLAPLPQR